MEQKTTKKKIIVILTSMLCYRNFPAHTYFHPQKFIQNNLWACHRAFSFHNETTIAS